MSDVTLGEYLIERYLPSRAFGWTAGTMRYRRWAIDHVIIPDLGERPLADLTPEEIEHWIAQRAITPFVRSGRLPSHGSLRGMLDTLKAALNHAVQRGVIPRNPARGVRLPRDGSEPRRLWTPVQVRTFLAGVDDTQWRLLWRLLFATGMRRGEALGLRWTDIDLDAGTVSIQRAMLADSREGDVRFGPPKTRRSRRTISIDAGTASLLRQWRVTRSEQHAEHLTTVLGGLLTPARLRDIPLDLPDDAPVFAHSDGTPLLPGSVSAAFRQQVAASGLPALRLHDVRHTHLTWLLRAGEPVHTVAARAGHGSPYLTLTAYAHVMPGDDERSAKHIGNALDNEPQAS